MIRERSSQLHMDLLDKLAEQTPNAAIDLLRGEKLATDETTRTLIDTALDQAETDTDRAERWLSIAEMLNQAGNGDASLRAYLYYARARIHLQKGDPQKAEEALVLAQQRWQALGDEASLTRSYLGMTQILALQGRFNEAQQAIQKAIAALPPNSLQLARSYRNLANLLTRQGRYQEALDAHERAYQILTQHLSTARQPNPAAPQEAAADLASLQDEIAHLELNRANVFVAFDRLDEAESAYRAAWLRFDENKDILNRGRVHTNLGNLYLQTGQYAAALEALKQAESDLLGDDPLVDDPLVDDQTQSTDRYRQADIFLLDQANTYLALNLLPEAFQALDRSSVLFRSADQPYELAQSLYLLGLLQLQQGQATAAQETLHEAKTLFSRLENRPWQVRADLALCNLAVQQQQIEQAVTRLDQLLETLLKSETLESETTLTEGASANTTTVVEAGLLRMQVALSQGEISRCEELAVTVQSLLDQTLPLPHLRLRLYHALGRLEAARGSAKAACDYFEQALDLLESQRTSLPMEEFRTAYLADKFHIYGDLVQSLLNAPNPDARAVARAFNVVERARARALLERMQAASNSARRTGAEIGRSAEEPDGPESLRHRTLQRRLHWLYNQALSNTGPLAEQATLRSRIEEYESELKRLAWQATSDVDSGLRRHVEPVTLEEFQAILAPGQQALVYYLIPPPAEGMNDVATRGEVLAFLVDRETVQLHRHLCQIPALLEAQDELRFQLGRAELGADYLKRHEARLKQGVNRALQRLHALLLAPFRDELNKEHLLIVPHGSLHQIPFHALWNGDKYLLEELTCTYAPSASIAVHCATAARRSNSYRYLAGFAINDDAIPYARSEVQDAARHFEQCQLYMDDEATLSALQQASAEVDVLHLATHGLFRPDNSFFSSLKLADGWIDVHAIYRLPLSAQLVVLSACESGTGEIQGGDEVVGLARGFLGAGAASLVASLWNVHDETAQQLMQHFYADLQKGNKPATALRLAQQTAAQDERHPYFWAPFFAVGQ